MFATACSPLTDAHVGNMASVGAGRGDTVGGRVTLTGWFIVAAVCLSPILTFWIGGILGRFLRRKQQSRVLRGGAVVADRPASREQDTAVDPK